MNSSALLNVHAAAVMLYDGHCRFCTRSARRLQHVVGASRLEIRSFQTPGALEAFPGVSHEACMQRIHLILRNGHVVRGAEAIARALASVPVIGLVAFLYYIPVFRWCSEWLYSFVARRRYRLFGRSESCDPTGTCHLH